MLAKQEFADVLVVGAGLSGLRAAVEIHQAGYSVIVLEARDRVGGKTLSLEASSLGGRVDLGAAWINDTNQSEMYSLAQTFGFDLVKQRDTGSNARQSADGKVVLFDPRKGDSVPSKRKYDLGLLYKAIIDFESSADPEKPHLSPKAKSLDAITFAEFAKQVCKTTDTVYEADTLATSLLGTEADELSALFMLDYIQSGTGLMNMISDSKNGGQYLRNRQGNQSFSTSLAALLPTNTVRTLTTVTRISQSHSAACIIETGDPKITFRAKRVVVSVPTCNLSSIIFEPPLPPAKRDLVANTSLGYYAKTVFIYDTPWWRDADLSGIMESEQGPIAFSRDTCVPQDNQYSITCFLVGDRGRTWSKWSAAERRKQVSAHFDAVLGEAARRRGVTVPAPINVIEKEWIKDPWAWGAPSPVMLCGVLTDASGRAIRTPIGNVHFVGTETSTVWKGYMEGAVRSGIRGAAEVIQELASANGANGQEAAM